MKNVLPASIIAMFLFATGFSFALISGERPLDPDESTKPDQPTETVKNDSCDLDKKKEITKKVRKTKNDKNEVCRYKKLQAISTGDFCEIQKKQGMFVAKDYCPQNKKIASEKDCDHKKKNKKECDYKKKKSKKECDYKKEIE